LKSTKDDFTRELRKDLIRKKWNNSAERKEDRNVGKINFSVKKNAGVLKKDLYCRFPP